MTDGRVDFSELVDHLRHNVCVGDLLDLDFDRAKVMRYDDECRMLQQDGARWCAVSSDLGLVATHLMAPAKQVSLVAQRKRASPPVCFDFNSTAGCNRNRCRFAHQCRRCFQPHSEAAAHPESGAGTHPKN